MDAGGPLGADGIIVAIETSFDDSAIAAVDAAGTILAGYVAGRVELHREWGGVVPEIAARSHITDLPALYFELKRHIDTKRIKAVAVTRGPGLVGSLLVGVNYAQGLSLGLGVPVMGLNHLEGHIVSPFLDAGDGNARRGRIIGEIPFPHIALVVSGGNTLLVRANALGDYTTLGETLDDAGGELLDKIAVALGRDYPGGATIERLAAHADAENPDTARWLARHQLPVPMRESRDLNFSYSGLKTAALRLMKAENITAGHPLEPAFCLALQNALNESLFIKAAEALRDNPDCRTLTLSGGVAANSALCANFRSMLAESGVNVLVPHKPLAVDNAEMMAYLAWLIISARGAIPLDDEELDAEPGLRL
ncbi:MAG: tRNA (adenosine(37)-N6)-threonylcarbamoyltransferase complex transferase subunit TsaD [bacterium]|jgi:N6-L-threonylcarbamoyladenine synthase